MDIKITKKNDTDNMIRYLYLLEEAEKSFKVFYGVLKFYWDGKPAGVIELPAGSELLSILGPSATPLVEAEGKIIEEFNGYIREINIVRQVNSNTVEATIKGN